MYWIEEYREILETAGKSNHTVESYTTDIREFLAWFKDTYGKEFDGKIIEQDLREYRSYLIHGAKLKPTSINRKLVALKSFNNFLVQKGTGIELNIRGQVVADPHDRQIRTIEKNALNRLKRAIYANGNKRDIAILELIINTGIRVSELVSLTLQDIVLTERNGSQNYSYVIIREGKGGKYREIPLNTTAKKALQEYLAVRNSDEEKLFLGQRGPLRRETIDKILKKYCRIAGIEDISAHVLRHTFCTRLMQEGTPIPVVSKLAGHSSINTTMSFYVNVSRSDKITAVEKLSQSF